MIFTTALVIVPEITRPLSDEGMMKLRSNVSDCSAIVSVASDILIVASLVPAAKVALTGAEL